MSIPKLTVYGELPPGIHTATVEEIESEFGYLTNQRARLMDGLKDAIENFRAAGVSSIFIDGSFITNKDNPNDIDGCWSAAGDIDLDKLDPLFWDSKTQNEKRANLHKLKARYGLDFYIAEGTENGSGLKFPDFFQVNREGKMKGIIRIDL